MNLRFQALFAMVAALAAVPATSAVAQYGPYQRGSAPSSVYDRQPPQFWADDDDEGAVIPQRPFWQNSQQTAQSVLPPPGRQNADIVEQPLPPPGIAQAPTSIAPGSAPIPPGPTYIAPPQAAAPSDAIRPPGDVGSRAGNGQAPTSAALPPEDQPETGPTKELPPELKRQLVEYPGNEPAGTLVVDTDHTYLYLVLGNGRAMRYGIGVGREGFTWAGNERISRMAEWPDWHPPAEMIERQPYLPRFMAGGPGNPLGARALYLGKTLYRIHGTNQPSTIGSYVSSGCIRLLNTDIEDLYQRVQVGTRVVVLPSTKAPSVVSNENTPNTASAAPAPARLPVR